MSANKKEATSAVHEHGSHLREMLVVEEEQRVARELHGERLEERDVVRQNLFRAEVKVVRDD